jgi:hypothetical protein
MSSERRGGGGFGAGFVLLVFVGFVVKFWVWILAAIVAVALVVLAYLLSNRARERRAVQRAADAAIVARADQQHAWTLAGDERGIYGEYTPSLFKLNPKKTGGQAFYGQP